MEYGQETTVMQNTTSGISKFFVRFRPVAEEDYLFFMQYLDSWSEQLKSRILVSLRCRKTAAPSWFPQPPEGHPSYQCLK